MKWFLRLIFSLGTGRFSKTLIILFVPKPDTQCKVWNINTVWTFFPCNSRMSNLSINTLNWIWIYIDTRQFFFHSIYKRGNWQNYLYWNENPVLFKKFLKNHLEILMMCLGLNSWTRTVNSALLRSLRCLPCIFKRSSQ